jgi:tetratricopeptide (TPR) repeat protein
MQPALRHFLHLLVALLWLGSASLHAQEGGELSEDARRLYNQALREAGALVKDKQYAGALTKLDALLVTRPREPQARFLKGIAQSESGATAAASETFRALTEDYPELPEPYNNLAVLLAQKGDYVGARAALESAIAASPDWAIAHENLGDLYARLAATHYERAAALDRDNKTAAAKLALAREMLQPRPPAAARP